MTARSHAVAAILVAVIGILVVTTPAATPAAAAPIENALTVFPSSVDVTVRPGQLIERSLGIVSTGAATGEATIEVVGPASDFIEVVENGLAIDRVRLDAGATSYVTLRIRPPASGAAGVHEAVVRVVPIAGEVRAGSTVDVSVEVAGQSTVDVELLELSVPDRIVIGRPFHVDALVDVGGDENVALEFAIVVDGAGGLVEQRAAPPAVGPGNRRSVRASWSTTAWTAGVHEATVVVATGGVEIGSALAPFDVVPDDDSMRSIDVLGAALVSRVEMGAVAKFEVTVQNNGPTEGRATFRGDVWLDDHVVHAVRSDPLLLAAGAIDTLTVYVPTDAAGTYRVRGRADLDGTESSTFAIPFTVDAPSGSGQRTNVVLIVVGVAALGGGAVAFWRRARNGA